MVRLAVGRRFVLLLGTNRLAIAGRRRGGRCTPALFAARPVAPDSRHGGKGGLRLDILVAVLAIKLTWDYIVGKQAEAKQRAALGPRRARPTSSATSSPHQRARPAAIGARAVGDAAGR